MTGLSGDRNLALQVFQLRVKVFCTLCERGSFTETAKLIGISQSAVSRCIAELEDDLGVSLFDHGVRPVRPTDAGQSLHRLLIREMDGIEQRLAELRVNNALLSPLRIGFVESIARAMSWSVISRVKKNFSTVTVQTGISTYLLRLLDEDAVDVIVCPDPFANRNDLERFFVFREPSVIILPRNTGLPADLTWERLQFSGLPILQYSSQNSGGRLQEKLFSKLHLSFVHRMEVDINALLLDYVAHGAGWALTRPTTLTQHPDLARRIEVRPMPEPVASREMYVVARKGRHTALATAVAKAASEEFRTALAPEIVRITPWVAPYLYCAGESPSDHVPVFPGSGEAPAGDVYVL